MTWPTERSREPGDRKTAISKRFRARLAANRCKQRRLDGSIVVPGSFDSVTGETLADVRIVIRMDATNSWLFSGWSDKCYGLEGK